MQNNGKLNDLAAAEIDALERDGIKLTPADIVQLNALGWAVETPSARLGLSRGVPVQVGGAWLWPLTLQAAEWLERVGPGIQSQNESAVVAYAMAHCYADGDALLLAGDAAADAVKRWVWSLRCTSGALAEAVEQVLDQGKMPETPPAPDGESLSMGDFSAFLSASCGATPDFWERRCSIGYALQVLNQVVRQNAADGKPTANDPKIIAQRALGWAAEKIRNRGTAAPDG